jgi:hypothetical protein
MMRKYFLPNSKITENAEEYIDAWKSLAKPMIEMTNTVLKGFDPGVTLQSNKDREIVQLPVWFLQAFNENYNKKGQ